MSGQLEPIWHVKVRRFGQTDYEIAEIRMIGPGVPTPGKSINVGIINFDANRQRREDILAKVDSFTDSTSGSRLRYTVFVTEQDNGNPPGHREATERDFQP